MQLIFGQFLIVGLQIFITGDCVVIYLVSKSNNESAHHSKQCPGQRGSSGCGIFDDVDDMIMMDGELSELATCKQSLQVQIEGGRSVKRNVKQYNLDMILAIGYRVRSHIGMQFRNWATSILTEYMKKGFALNDARLKNPKQFGDDYFDELLVRIRDIRASEKRFYMKVRDIYALSVDYNPKLEVTKDFFATGKYQTQKWNSSHFQNTQSFTCED